MKIASAAWMVAWLVGAGCYVDTPDGLALSLRFEGSCGATQDDAAMGDDEPGCERATFYADGSTIARLRIEVPDDTGVGNDIKVSTSLGELSPGAADPKSRTVQTLGAQSLVVDLFVGQQAGQGIVTVEAKGLADTAELVVLPLTNTLAITPPVGPVVADGHTLHELTITLDTETDAPQSIIVNSTRGKLDPAGEGAAAFQRTLKIQRDTPLTLQLLAPAPGSSQSNDADRGQIRAKIGDGPEIEASFEILRATEQIELSVEPGPYYADDRTTVPIQVAFTSEIQDLRTITLRASKGVLEGSSDGQSTTVHLRGGESTEVLLLVQRELGLAVITASVADDGGVSLSLPLLYSPPTLMTVIAKEPLLTTSNQFIEHEAYFGRPLGEGKVSEGTRVYFTSCCDADGDGTPSACDLLVELPAFTDASTDEPDQVAATAYLTVAGKAYVETVVMPPLTDLLVDVYAYVVDAGFEPAVVDCVALADGGDLPGITALDSTTIALRQVDGS